MTQPASGPGSFSFPKSARLLRRAEFLAVKAQGRSFAEGPLAASWAPRNVAPGRAVPRGAGSVGARVGLAVSSKVGDSVERNRIKRKLREAIRLELSGLPPVELVLVARSTAGKTSVEQFRGWLRRAAVRMRREGRPA